MPDFLKLQAIVGGIALLSPRRHESPREAQLGRLFQALIPLADSAHLAAEPDFAEADQIGGEREIR